METTHQDREHVLGWTEPELLEEDVRRSLLGSGAPFELVDDDVCGKPCPVFRTRPASVVDLITRAAAHGERPALCGPETTVEFISLPDAVGAVAGRLRDHGVRPGDRVVLCAATSVESILVLLAAVAVGAVAVPVNPRWGDGELDAALGLVDPSLVAGDAPSLERQCVSARRAVAVSELGDPVGREPDVLAAPGEDDPFAIVFTSGTTGRSKGATLSHRNAVHFCMSTAATSLVRGMVTGVSPGAGGPPTVIASAPLFHVSGLLGQLVNGLAWGITLVLAPPGPWDAGEHLELTERHGVTTWSLVPTQLRRVLEHPDLERRDVSTLSTVGGGGATFPPELLRTVHERLPHVRAGLRVGYGMTEAAGTITLLQPPIDDQDLGSVGPPVAGAEVQIRDHDGTPLPPNEIGMIWARSASIFLGYWADDEATAAVLDGDRWYATGDFGRIDRGLLWLESRLRDLIIRGGENIYPIEIENRLVEHPDIAAAAVVGQDDDDLGQVVRAVLVRRPGSHLDTAGVQEWVRDALAPFKVPAVVDFRDELPVNDLGKVLKHQI